MKEKLLVKKAKKGDVEAFGKLYEMVYRKLYQYAYFTLNSKEDAEDAVGETVTDAFFQISSLRVDEAFEGWIFQILSNKCKHKMKDYSGRRENEVAYGQELLFEDPEGKVQPQVSMLTGPSEHSVDIEQRIDLEQAMGILTYEERRILALNVILGYTTKEISEAMNTNENTIRSKKMRSLIRLRGILQDSILE